MKRPATGLLGAAGMSLLGGLAGGIAIGWRHGIPFVTRDSEYAIAIYRGPDPERLAPAEGAATTALTARDVTDLPARFVADPFLLRRDGLWHLYFEVIDRRTERGCIGYASSLDAARWTYGTIVLSEPFHISYPCVFEWDGDVFMIPESSEAYGVRLYRAARFPDSWEYVTTLLHGPFVDSTPFRHAGRWWLFTAVGWGNLHLFSADELLGPWREHPQSPLIVGDDARARPGGRVVCHNGALIRFGQDDSPYYGRQLRAFRVTTLSEEAYAEVELPSSPLLTASGHGWNSRGMHHLDAHQLGAKSWLAAVDGFRSVLLINRRRVYPRS